MGGSNMPWINVDGEMVHVTMRRDKHGVPVEFTDEDLEAFKALVRTMRDDVKKHSKDKPNG